jgi:hypothetical protein
MPVVIEVVARLGETTLDLAHLAPGDTYRLGTVSLATDASPRFERRAHQVGLVTVTMERTFRTDIPVPAPRVDLRPKLYILVSLAVHVLVWWLSVSLAPFEKLRVRDDRPLYRLVHVPQPPPEVPPPPPPRRVQAKAASAGAAAGEHTRHARGRRAARGASEGITTEKVIAGVLASVPEINEKTFEGATTYNEDEANEKGFGGHLWDIDNDPDFATVKTGPGYDLSELAEAASLYGLAPAEKNRRRIEQQTALARTSAIRGDCVPSHRISKWLKRLDADLYKQIFLSDPEVAYCLTQPVPPSFIAPANK